MKSFVEHLSKYAAYHRDKRNVATHYIGVPMIMAGVVTMLSRPALMHINGIAISPATIGVMITALFYLKLDIRFGIVMSVFLATCLWLGATGSGMFLLWTGVMGGMFCLALLFARFHSRPYLLGAPGWVVQLMEPRGDIPYGVAIAAGALMAYPASPLLAAFIAG